MAYLIHWHLVFIQVLFIQFYITAQNTDQDNKNTEIEKIEIAEGTYQYNLPCREGSKPIIWKKNGSIIPFPINNKFDFTTLPSYFLPLLCVNKNHEGMYTCHAKENINGLPLKIINVQVTKLNKVDPCGADTERELVQKDYFECESYLEKNYPCCKRIPVAAEELDTVISSWLGDSDNQCDIYKGINSFKNPWNVFVSWRLDSIGTYGTWGWQISLVGLAGDPGFAGYCVQINSRDKILNWTIPADDLTMGVTYKITLQTLPESTSRPNSKFKIIRIPNLQDMCETIGRDCNWEICLPVENVTVKSNLPYPLVSWLPSSFYKSRHVFEVSYWDENNSDSDRIIVQNKSHLQLTNLKYKYSHKYFVEVRPIFIKDEIEYGRINGKSCEKLVFYVADPPDPPIPIPPQSHSHKLKIIISVCVTTAAILAIIFIYIRNRRKKPHNSPPVYPSGQPTDVLLVHDGHCNLCDNVTHIFANVLSETGHIKCSLDLCSTSEIAELGYDWWYVEKFQKCKKIVVICTKEAKKTHGQGSNTNVTQSSFRLVLSMILGEKSHNNNKVQVVPVCFDYSSSDDIPCFLKDRQYYSLPSGIKRLLSCLSGFNARPIDDMAEYELEHTNEFQRKVRQWENAIRSVQKSHCPRKDSLISYVRSLSSSSADEPSRDRVN